MCTAPCLAGPSVTLVKSGQTEGRTVSLTAHACSSLARTPSLPGQPLASFLSLFRSHRPGVAALTSWGTATPPLFPFPLTFACCFFWYPGYKNLPLPGSGPQCQLLSLSELSLLICEMGIRTTRTPAAAAAAKLLQSCPTLCNPIDGSPPGSPVPGFSRQEHWSGFPLPSPMHESEK